jgi:hypothetical protein
LVDFLRIGAISKILGKGNGRLDIFRLGRFVPTRKQDDQFSTSFGIVNPVSRTDVDLEFADPCSQPSVLAWISVCEPIDSNLDARSTLTVLEGVNPVPLDLRHP